jgi:hypothetical protein
VADVFISYSRRDRDFVRGLNEALEKRDYDVWVDMEDIPPTAEWLAEVYSGIEGSNVFVFVISPDSIASKVCQQELAHAVEHNKRLVPIVCREVDPEDVPESDLANNLATPALSEARQKRETSPRFPRPTAKDGSVVGAGFVARTIPSAGNRNREERSCTKRRSLS